jgi:uncharacterized membrane protein YGL010W
MKWQAVNVPEPPHHILFHFICLTVIMATAIILCRCLCYILFGSDYININLSVGLSLNIDMCVVPVSDKHLQAC